MEITECPQCGAAASPSDRKSSYCKSEFFVSLYTSPTVVDMTHLL